MPSPLVLAADVEHELVEKKSRFIARLHRIGSVEEAEAIIRAARAEHPDARHHCTALVLAATADSPTTHRSNDDGEPAGTAGMPMLQALLHAGLEDALVVAIRYFGGIKLGAGGLTRTYGRSVTEAIEHARETGALRERLPAEEVAVEVGLDLVGPVENQVRTWCAARPGSAVDGVEYGPRTARIAVVVPVGGREELEQDVAAWSSGRGSVELVGARTLEAPLR